MGVGIGVEGPLSTRRPSDPHQHLGADLTSIEMDPAGIDEAEAEVAAQRFMARVEAGSTSGDVGAEEPSAGYRVQACVGCDEDASHAHVHGHAEPRIPGAGYRVQAGHAEPRIPAVGGLAPPGGGLIAAVFGRPRSTSLEVHPTVACRQAAGGHVKPSQVKSSQVKSSQAAGGRHQSRQNSASLFTLVSDHAEEAICDREEAAGLESDGPLSDMACGLAAAATEQARPTRYQVWSSSCTNLMSALGGSGQCRGIAQAAAADDEEAHAGCLDESRTAERREHL